mmetsp:Transcript_14179/g.34366  ORF Transcript_14179/g.34366 Transcript_14179/m.34366 type:complete len:233 (+) Transcript_14179:144-842(+)
MLGGGRHPTSLLRIALRISVTSVTTKLSATAPFVFGAAGAAAAAANHWTTVFRAARLGQSSTVSAAAAAAHWTATSSSSRRSQLATANSARRYHLAAAKSACHIHSAAASSARRSQSAAATAAVSTSRCTTSPAAAYHWLATASSARRGQSAAAATAVVVADVGCYSAEEVPGYGPKRAWRGKPYSRPRPKRLLREQWQCCGGGRQWIRQIYVGCGRSTAYKGICSGMIASV